MTLREALRKTQAALEAAGLENARNESRWIVCAAAEAQVTDLDLLPDQALTRSQMNALSSSTERRKRREPLQHILGDVEFCDRVIEVTPDALIPRPETEWLVETLLTRLPARREWAILDAGTGTGAIAITLATRLPSQVIGIDISPPALRLASRNAIRNRVRDALDLLRADLHAPPFRGNLFDLIISNPPYILSDDIEHLETEVRDHEPMLALDGGTDGLTCYRSLARLGRSCLKPGGTLAIELPGHPPDPIAALFTRGYTTPQISDDWSGKPRLLMADRLT